MPNHILAALGEDRVTLLFRMQHVELVKRQKLETANQSIAHVYFLEFGYAGVFAGADTQTAVAMIGCEGATGISLFLGDSQSPNATVMLTDGSAQRIAAPDLIAAMDERPELKRVLLRYSRAFLTQVQNTTVANIVASMDQRIARFVLMAQDRFPGDEVPLTHDTIAYILGVRRSGVSIALEELTRRGFIAVKRGSFRIQNREGLEAHVGKNYGVPEREFVRLVGTYWPPVAPPEAARIRAVSQ